METGAEGKKNRRTVWNINTEPFKGAHFAVFPSRLVELCMMAGSKEGDLILDPFLGSGTTGAVARRLKRRCVGIEATASASRTHEATFEPGEREIPAAGPDQRV